MIIDFHTHCFPDALAPKAIKQLSEASGLTPSTDGTLSGLKALMKAQGVSAFVVNNIAATPRQQQKVNDFAISVNGGGVVSFGSVNPYADNVFEEIERLKENGISGVKFHPEYQGFYVDEDFMLPIYKKLSREKLIVLFHAGWDIGYKPPYHGTPERFARIAEIFDTDVVLAHWGGSNMDREVLETLCGLGYYFDTSFGKGYISPDSACEIVLRQGTSKILFGSDSPWSTPEREVELIKSLNLGEKDEERIFSQNAVEILKKRGIILST